MKVVQINAYCAVGSTGKICQSISDILTSKGIENYILYTQYKTDYLTGVKYGGNKIYTKVQSLKSRLLGNNGFNSFRDTKKLIQILEQISPDVIHLHNLHAQNCNLEILFNYLKSKNIKVFWTFHDCWAFTAYCYYFDMISCTKWKTGCQNCPQSKKYSWFIDRANMVWNKKSQLTDSLDFTIVTPSKWLSKMVEQSIFSNQKTIVINNGINLSIFMPKDNCVKKNLGIQDKYMLLGVADLWDERKGIDIFVKLSECLSDKYALVLVGTNTKVDRMLPSKIISIHHTKNQCELADYYSAADVFVNPTREEVFGMVNIEALACGTPVVTFDSGGSPECIDSSCGIVVEKNDVKGLVSAIETIICDEKFTKENCIERASLFDQTLKFKEYIELYLQ